MFGVGEAVAAVAERLAGGSGFDFLQADGKRSSESKKTEMDRNLFILVARVELRVDVLKDTADKISNDK
jgi:hypothetical protein